MRRWKLWLFGILAVVATAAAVLYAFAVAPGAKTKLDVAILVFTAAAAVTGFLGLLVAWLSYLLEAGRIPKPDLAIVSSGQLSGGRSRSIYWIRVPVCRPRCRRNGHEWKG